LQYHGYLDAGLICIPHDASKVYYFRTWYSFYTLDYSTSQTSPSTPGKWFGGVPSPDGKYVYCIPFNAVDVLKFAPPA